MLKNVAGVFFFWCVLDFCMAILPFPIEKINRNLIYMFLKALICIVLYEIDIFNVI